MKKTLILLVPVLLTVLFPGFLIAVSCSTSNKSHSSFTPAGAAQEFVSSMKIGWNLGNSMDAHNNGNTNETAWGNPPATQELMEAVADLGFGAVRIPVTWLSKIGPAPDYKLDEEWLNRVAEVVEYVRTAEMKAIINIHHDGADSHYWLSVKTEHLKDPEKTEIDNQFIAVWKQIAEKFKDTDDYLIFESFNELHDGSWGNGSSAQHKRVNELNQIFVDTVRAVGGKNSSRYLVIPGWVTRPSVTVSSLVMPTDRVPGKIIVSFHYYDPYTFTGDAAVEKWGENGPASIKWANEAYVRKTFDSVKAKFTNNGIPVIIGEYGVVNHPTFTGKDYRVYYMEYITKYAFDCGFVPFYWDNGGFGEGKEKFGIIDRYPPHDIDIDADLVIEAMMRAVNKDYLLSDIKSP